MKNPRDFLIGIAKQRLERDHLRATFAETHVIVDMVTVVSIRGGEGDGSQAGDEEYLRRREKIETLALVDAEFRGIGSNASYLGDHVASSNGVLRLVCEHRVVDYLCDSFGRSRIGENGKAREGFIMKWKRRIKEVGFRRLEFSSPECSLILTIRECRLHSDGIDSQFFQFTQLRSS